VGVLIRVLVTACTSGELLVVQAQALERHMVAPDDWDFIVVNDAKEDEHFSNNWERGKAEEIEAAARDIDAIHHRFPQEWHTDRRHVFPDEPDEFVDIENANTRCADAVQYGVNLLLGENVADPILILDADMVPYRAVDPATLLRVHPVWGVRQTRGGIVYLWNGLILVDPDRALAMNLFNLDCAHIDGTPCDVGGMLYRFVQANQHDMGGFDICSAVAHIAMTDGSLPPRLWDFFKWDCDAQYDHYRISETYGNVFAHLGGGGNWEVRDKDEADERLRRFIKAVS
jgi:hypothetical protein